MIAPELERALLSLLVLPGAMQTGLDPGCSSSGRGWWSGEAAMAAVKPRAEAEIQPWFGTRRGSQALKQLTRRMMLMSCPAAWHRCLALLSCLPLTFRVVLMNHLVSMCRLRV